MLSKPITRKRAGVGTSGQHRILTYLLGYKTSTCNESRRFAILQECNSITQHKYSSLSASVFHFCLYFSLCITNCSYDGIANKLACSVDFLFSAPLTTCFVSIPRIVHSQKKNPSVHNNELRVKETNESNNRAKCTPQLTDLTHSIPALAQCVDKHTKVFAYQDVNTATIFSIQGLQ